ncbi:MAG: radical SAM protein [Bdellovibrio sp.]|nr:radical SAM protein [Bdellovibrio sp.]
MEVTFIIPKVEDLTVAIFSFGIPYISSFVKQHGHSVKLINGQILSDKKYKTLINSITSPVIGISTYHYDIREFFELTHFLKKKYPQKIIVAGGRGPASFPLEYIFSHGCADYIVLNEGEIPFNQLLTQMQAGNFSPENVPNLAYLKKGKITLSKQQDALMENLDNLPFPDRDLIDQNFYLKLQKKITGERLIRIVTSRGCPHVCLFCDKSGMGNKIRLRSADSVIAEIEFCMKKYKTNHFFFIDDLFVHSKSRLIEFCEKILQKKLKIRWEAHARVNSLEPDLYPLLKKSGLEQLFFGIESGSQTILDRIQKGISVPDIKKTLQLCRKHAIKSFGYFIVGVPGESKKDHEATLKLIEEGPIDGVEVFYLLPYMGSPIFNKLYDRNSFSWEDYCEWTDVLDFKPSMKSFLKYHSDYDPSQAIERIMSKAPRSAKQQKP